MPDLQLAWDQRKERQNVRKHGVSFNEAISVFSDEAAILLDDPEHSDAEDRFLLLGLSVKLRVLVVCHCYREEQDVIRLISARRATRQERATYARKWKA